MLILTNTYIRRAVVVSIALFHTCDGSERSRSKDLHDDKDILDSQSAGDGILVLPLLTSHHVLSRRRRELKQRQRQLQAGSVRKDSSSSFNDTFEEYPPSGSLYNGYGTHYVDIWVGEGREDRSARQRQTLIVDTGSRVTAFPCNNCESCGDGYHANDPFDDGDSLTFERSRCGHCTIGSCVFGDGGVDDWCGIEMKYAEGSSWYAYEATDLVYFGVDHDEGDSTNDADADGDDDDNDDERRDRHLNISAYYEDDDHTEDMQPKFLDEAQNAKERAKQQQAANEEPPSSSMQSGESLHTNEFQQPDNVLKPQMQPPQSQSTPSSDPAFQLSFGCQTRITGLFQTQLADGIMGMENSHISFWNQMYRAGMIKSKAFALCYADAGTRATKEGVPAGTMTLGGADSRLHKNAMRYAHNRKRKGWYEVYVKGIHLRMPNTGREDGVRKNVTETLSLPLDMLQFNSKGVMIDSGTTESYLPAIMEEPLEEAFLKMAGIPFKSEYSKSFFKGTDINDTLPTIVFQLQAAEPSLDDFDGTEWKDVDGQAQPGLAGYMDEDSPKDPIFEIEPSKYLTYHDKTETYTMGLHLTEGMDYTILGANAMFGYNILFDIENNRIGFAKSDCRHDILKK